MKWAMTLISGEYYFDYDGANTYIITGDDACKLVASIIAGRASAQQRARGTLRCGRRRKCRAISRACRRLRLRHVVARHRQRRFRPRGMLSRAHYEHGIHFSLITATTGHHFFLARSALGGSGIAAVPTTIISRNKIPCAASPARSRTRI